MGEQLIHVPKVKLGSQGMEVSRIGFGCIGLSGTYNAPLLHEDGCSMIVEAFHRGVTFFDTSDIYGQDHDNEIMIGKALKVLPRERIQVATKFGLVRLKGNRVGVDGSPQYARKCCEASLKRLGVDYIDLFYPHKVDTSLPIEDTMGELKKLVEEGKVRYVGLSDPSIDTIKRAHAIHPITAVQMEYSLWTRDIAEEVIPLCRSLGIGIVTYSPLGIGFFASKAVTENTSPKGMLAMHPRFVGQNMEKNKAVYRKFAELASKYDCSPPQLALAWLLNQGDDIVPIPGTTKAKNLRDNIRSVDIELSPNNLREISEAVDIDEVYGEKDIDIMARFYWKYADTPAKPLSI
ncbi:hypothetical protein MLD38_018071 [Melastoma candidum]|uniref:Uncharacterized protein n=1 Tax=Melastoma candidum TaxID=119954 RepID=A0ACB9QT76_9MYRT|nr:hypothetical protein MLD38_018071 [Melastoma candidum]